MHFSCISATTRPARRILAISSEFLRIGTPQTAVDRPDQPGGHLVGVADAIDGDELVLLHVPGDERRRLLFVQLEAAADGVYGVVLALDGQAAAEVALLVNRRRALEAVVGAAFDT